MFVSNRFSKVHIWHRFFIGTNARSLFFFSGQSFSNNYFLTSVAKDFIKNFKFLLDTRITVTKKGINFFLESAVKIVKRNLDVNLNNSA